MANSQSVFADEGCPKGQKIVNLEARYAEIIRMHKSYVSVGMGLEADKLRQEASAITAEIPYAYLHQEIAFFPISKQPYCMIAVLSKITGLKTAVQPRSDSKWNIYINNVITHEGLSDSELLGLIKSAAKM